jgi:hypothetical protein
MSVIPARMPMRVRSVFISDVHLGYRGCRAECLEHFLRSIRTQNLGGIEIHREYVHQSADGKRLLLLHGDQFDESVINEFPPLVKRFGGLLYDAMLAMNHLLHSVRRRGFDGTVCGHIHRSAQREHERSPVSDALDRTQREADDNRPRSRSIDTALEIVLQPADRVRLPPGLDRTAAAQLAHPRLDLRQGPGLPVECTAAARRFFISAVPGSRRRLSAWISTVVHDLCSR